MQGHLGGYSGSNIVEGLFTEDGKGTGKSIFEAGFKFSDSESRKKFDSTASADGVAIGERSGSDGGVNGKQAIEQLLVIYGK